MAVVTGTVIGAVGTLTSVGMNLSAAAQQSKAQSAAEQAAADAAAKAEAEYQREFAGGVQLPMEAYQQAGREGTAQQMQALQALQESDTRSLAAGVGKVQAAATEAQTGITEQMRQDLFSLESAQMQEKMSNRDQIARMNEERAMGAQKAAANAQAAKTAAITGAISGVASLGEQVVKAAPLFKEKKEEDLSGVTIGNTTGMGSTMNSNFQSPSSNRFGAPAPAPQAFGPQNAYGIFEQYPGLTYNSK